MSRPRLVVSARSRARVNKLRGGRIGTTEEAVICYLLDLHDAVYAALLGSLDKQTGAPTKNQESGTAE